MEYTDRRQLAVGRLILLASVHPLGREQAMLSDVLVYLLLSAGVLPHQYPGQP